MSDDAKIYSLSDENLTVLNFLGPGSYFTMSVRSVPKHFRCECRSLPASPCSGLTDFASGARCISGWVPRCAAQAPAKSCAASAKSTSSETILLSRSSDSTDTHDYICSFECVWFYQGIATDPPPLLQRSDLMQRPFPIPEKIPTQNSTPVKPVHFKATFSSRRRFGRKESVAPQIMALFVEASHGIWMSSTPLYVLYS
ncbi:hypothetical protein BDW22DRAFT_1432421 [Trametopsis cervina]|nr:hypothetical protein BDW22DRAFT_1432421 [Trametopsis cervina]